MFRLAIQCGYPHPRLMLERMTARELKETMAYAMVEPFGEYRSELRHGQQMAMTANINRDSKLHPEMFQPVDFMNFIDRPEERPMTPEEMAERIDREVFGL